MIIPINNQDYYEVLAFAIPDILQKWGSQIREVLTDSSCKIENILIINKHSHTGQGNVLGVTGSSLSSWVKLVDQGYH